MTPGERRPGTVDALVVGGGPCGLAAALAMARKGLSVSLIEAAPDLGGMAASFTVAGQRVDYGSHRLHPSISARSLALLNELLGADLQVRPRNGRLHVRDRWVEFPLRSMDLVRNLPPSFTLAAIRDLAVRRLRSRDEDSYAAVVRRGLGTTALVDFHGPMAQKLWGLSPEELSGDLARKRISVRSPSALARTLARRPSQRTFLYPRLGYGQIVDRLVEAAGDAGVNCRVSTSVTSLHVDQHGALATLSSGLRLHARRVLWTASPTALASAVGVAPGPSGAEAPRVAMRGLVLVYLVLDVEQFTPFDAHYVPDGDIAFSRLSEPRNYRDGPDPAGQTVLCAEIPCTEGDPIWCLDADQLASLVVDGMARCSLPTPPVREVEVRRLPAVYPVLTVGDHQARPRELGHLERLDRVTLVGRQGLLVADNLHHVLDMAFAAADCIGPAGAWDDEAWIRHRTTFDGFVVED